jgi:DNA modification methylase
MSQHFLKLRANIALPGDVQLAQRELSKRYERVVPVEDEAALAADWGLALDRIVSHSRPNAFAGFIGLGPKQPLERICRELACVQEIWLPVAEVDLPPSDIWAEVDGYACVLPWMAAGELWGISKTHPADPSGLPQLVGDFAQGRDQAGLQNRGTAAPHLHGLHRYKARFFPRLARMLLHDADTPVLDPFVGSGTTLVEASLLGQVSRGVDIDPLSCLISQAKLDLLHMLPKTLEEGIRQLGEPVEGGAYTLPPWMARKFERKGELEAQAAYEATISAWVQALERVEDPVARRVLSVCISDGINRKFNVRMMGTGVGRFALEIRKTRLEVLLRKSMNAALRQARIFTALKAAYGLEPAPAEVVKGDAGNLPFEEASQGFILTSPPYLPAASGREAYLFSKSIALTALGLMSVEEIEAGRAHVVGSMKAGATAEHTLPQGVYDLVDWLAQDALRSIKSQPTLAYYQDLQRALAEAHRVLRPGAKACWVVGKESVFYTFKTREVLRRVPCAQLFIDLAEEVGFKVVERIDIELQKRNLNARPRSKDPYFESAIVLQKSA